MQVKMDMWGFPGNMNVCTYMSRGSDGVCSYLLLPMGEFIGLFPGVEFSGKFLSVT